MEITLHIEDNRYHPDDIVERRNKYNDKSIFVKIESVTMEGNWRNLELTDEVMQNPILAVGAGARAYITYGTYVTTVQEGSYYDSQDGELTLIRPGTCLTFDVDELDKHNPALYKGKVISKDTIENIDERYAKWESSNTI